MIIDKLSDVVLLDGNGKLFNWTGNYFNRFQSTIPHMLRILCVAVKHNKTIGGYIYDRPVVQCSITYGTWTNRCTFEAEFIEQGIFGFPQMIPVETGITLNFDYGYSDSYAKAVKEIPNKEKEHAKDDRRPDSEARECDSAAGAGQDCTQ